ncbi:MAG: class I tRNA ligase family protein, partial [Bacteroidales bacterium]|nr:class I tRNA ligase family protein [Bacteroidales bacterium]
MEIIVPPAFPDYELIDSGNHEKLERFGRFIICRPEPQALWNKNLPEAEWEKMAHAVFRRSREQSQGTWEGERGEWKKYREMPDQWNVQYTYAGYSFRMRLGLTAFGHVGIFPEQSFNWNFLMDFIPKYSHGTFRLLNLFAYTGASSLAARAAGADVTHVDSVKNVLTWARQNMEASGLNDIRWVPEHVKLGRFGNWLEGARDWNISRSRFWGTPIPVWECARPDCGARHVLGSIAEIQAVTGRAVTDLHKEFLDAVTVTCPKCGGAMRRVP